MTLYILKQTGEQLTETEAHRILQDSANDAGVDLLFSEAVWNDIKDREDALWESLGIEIITEIGFGEYPLKGD